MNLENGYDAKILELLETIDKPTDIEKIRLSVGIANWSTALSHCLSLLVAKKINGVKTSKSWVFWSKNRTVAEYGILEKIESMGFNPQVFEKKEAVTQTGV